MSTKSTKVKTIGILGGMGPEATLLFYEKIVKLTKAEKDQEHIPTLIYSNTKIPDRTSCILKGKHEKIIKELQKSAKILERGGVDFITIPCNTTHYYIKEIKESIKIPVLDMIKETAKHIHEEYKEEKKVVLLATSGTIFSQLYQNKFKNFGIKIIIPEKKVQEEEVMIAIYNVKANKQLEKSRRLIEKVMKNLRKRHKIKVIILGCTELPLLFRDEEKDTQKDTHTIDPMDILARIAILKAGGKIRGEE
jgi:aspartate racemase